MRLPLTLFVDTNVLIDRLAPRIEFAHSADQIFSAASFGDVRLWFSTSMATDLFYILMKIARDGPGRIQGALEDLFFTRRLERVRLHPVTSADIREALLRGWEDFGDCLASVCAERVRADFIVTRDRGGFRDSAVPAISPERVIELLRDDFGITYDDVEW